MFTWGPNQPAQAPAVTDDGFLLHFDGANGSTTFVEAFGRTQLSVTPTFPVISTSSPRFGSGKGDFSSIYDNRVEFATVGDPILQLGSSDFTIEWWINHPAPTTTGRTATPLMSSIGGSNDAGFATFLFTSNAAANATLSFVAYLDPLGTTSVSMAGAFPVGSLGVWQHMAVSRTGSAFSMYVDGTRVATATNAGSIRNTTGKLCVGGWGLGGINPATARAVGGLDEVRIIRGAGKGIYSGATITVPSAPFLP